MGEILITADLLPTKTNERLFEDGKTEELFGEEILSLFQKCDYRIINLEGPITDCENRIAKDGPCLKGSVQSFRGFIPLQIDTASIANNHIMDYGTEGFESTVQVLQKAGICTCGAGRNLKEAGKPHIFMIDNLKIGLLSCAEYEFTIATESNAGAYPFDPMEILDEIEKLKKQTDYVIILYHGGKEYYRYPVPYVQRRCRKMAEKGADLIICQHCHCIGCKEEYKGSTIVYGQGNLLLDRGSDEFRNSGLIIVCNPGQKKIEYHPVVRKDNTVRMADGSQRSAILDDFYRRSQEIMKENFVKEQYEKFAMGMFDIYRCHSLGILGKIIRKVHLMALYNLFFRKKEYLNIVNTLRCEAHRDLFVCGLAQKTGIFNL